MQKNIFLIPHKENFILYAPLKGIISLINSKAAAEILKIDGDEESKINEVSTSLNTNPLSINDNSISNLTFILTSNCTMSCIYCYANGGKSNKTLSWNIFTDIIDHVIQINKKVNKSANTNISFHGGDISAVWQLFKDAINYIEENFKKNNLPFTMSTGINGVLSKSQKDFIIKRTANATVSLDGFSEIQNLNRPLFNGKSSFNQVDKTLKYFDNQGYNYGIRSTVTSDNVNKLEGIIEFFCKRYTTKKIMVEPMFPLGRGSSIKAPSSEDFVSNFRKAKLIAKSYERKLTYSGARLDTTTSVFCKALEDSVVITPEGLISCCYEIIDKENPVSDYFIHGYFDKERKQLIFDKQKQANLQEIIIKENEKCSDCFCKFHCAGDCPVKTISSKFDDSGNGLDRCYINKELTKDQLLEVLGEEYSVY
jgi:uncharacterized protein